MLITCSSVPTRVRVHRAKPATRKVTLSKAERATYQSVTPARRNWPGRWLCVFAFLFTSLWSPTVRAASTSLGRQYSNEILPILKQNCLGCHSTEKQKGDLDLERFTSFSEIIKHPK